MLCNDAIANRFSKKMGNLEIEKYVEDLLSPVSSQIYRGSEIIFSCLLDLRSFSIFNSSHLERDGPFYQYIVQSTFLQEAFGLPKNLSASDASEKWPSFFMVYSAPGIEYCYWA